MSQGLILSVAFLGLGMHPAAWRGRDGAPQDYFDPAFYVEVAKAAEDGLLQALFLADTLAVEEENYERPNLGAMDPAAVLGLLAGATRRIGLVGTASTTYNEPYSLARRFQAIDHLSDGRAGWNVVTTFAPTAAANFGTAALPRSEDRYDRAEEFVDVVRQLWLSWRDGALVGDKAGGVFADTRHVQPIDHRGKHFSVKGPATLPRSRQGHPVLFQSGASGPGRELAARTADAVFTVKNTLATALDYRQDLRRRAVAFGRRPDAIKVLPGLVPIIGATEAEARARKQRLDELGGASELRKLALRVGVKVEDLVLDRPLPFDLIDANADFRGSEGFRSAVVDLARREQLTVRELLYHNGGGHLQVVGTPQQVADTLEQWYRAGAADGFNLALDMLPEGLYRFIESVVPLLQRRGLFHTAYEGTTLRQHLGVETPS
jgi:FMN-dependent oxidoreductase (nitrilotriacetate monooxygenase family)